ncbi:unnamed protein product [Owenia fusiformis]|uniref:Uncharacterized protein n=1 Tax=Owenia fusiformis TaxID=6347 RepID=A0A8J1U0H1_OWEFU|nr:unnamed protein product [Owenia fusiformis]
MRPIDLIRFLRIQRSYNNWAKNLTSTRNMAVNTQIAPKQITTFVVYDLETTGFQDRPKITEMSMIAVHRNDLLSDTRIGLPRVLNKLTICVYPMKEVCPGAADVTGLHNDNLYFQKDFDEESGQMIMSFLRRLAPPVCLIAHNGNSYDHGILRNELDFSKTGISGDLLCADSLPCFRQLDSPPKLNGQISTPDGACAVDTPPIKGIVDQSQNETGPTNGLQRSNSVKRELFGVSATASSMDEMNDFDWSVDVTDEELMTINLRDMCNSNNNNENKKHENDGQLLSQSQTAMKLEKVPTYPGTPKRPITTPNNSQETPVKKTKKLSYKLGEIYKRELKKPLLNAHCAEDDCIMLLEIMRKRAPSVCEWMDNHAVPFINIQPRYKVRYQRSPLPTGQFPFQGSSSQN